MSISLGLLNLGCPPLQVYLLPSGGHKELCWAPWRLPFPGPPAWLGGFL